MPAFRVAGSVIVVKNTLNCFALMQNAFRGQMSRVVNVSAAPHLTVSCVGNFRYWKISLPVKSS